MIVFKINGVFASDIDLKKLYADINNKHNRTVAIEVKTYCDGVYGVNYITVC